MKCFVEIDEKINSFIRKDLKIERYITPQKWSTHDWVNVKIFDVLNDKGLRKLESLQPQTDALVFRLDPHANGTIHEDTDSNGLIPFGMNWILQGDGVMEWYTPTTRPNRLPGDFSPYPHWTEDTAGPVIASWSGKNALVKTDIAHRVRNTSDSVRVCFAVKFDCKDWNIAEEWIAKNA